VSSKDQLKKNDKSVIQVGGALGQINLSSQAYEHLPLARVRAVFEKYLPNGKMERPSILSDMIGTVPINADMWTGDVYADLARCGHDCESASRI
jgi:hypothetical protein